MPTKYLSKVVKGTDTFYIKDTEGRQSIQDDCVKTPYYVISLPSTITDDMVGRIYYVPITQSSYVSNSTPDGQTHTLALSPIELSNGDKLFVQCGLGGYPYGWTFALIDAQTELPFWNSGIGFSMEYTHGTTQQTSGTKSVIVSVTGSEGAAPTSVIYRVLKADRSSYTTGYHAYIAAKQSNGTKFFKRLTDENRMLIKKITDSNGSTIYPEVDTYYVDQRTITSSPLAAVLPPVLEFGDDIDSKFEHKITFYVKSTSTSPYTPVTFTSADGKKIKKNSAFTYVSDTFYTVTATWNGSYWYLDRNRYANY